MASQLSIDLLRVRSTRSMGFNGGSIQRRAEAFSQSPMVREPRLVDPQPQAERQALQIEERVLSMLKTPHAALATGWSLGQRLARPMDMPVVAPATVRQAPIQRKATGSADAVAQEVLARRPAGGQNLPENVRTFMEQAFGADFSRVRVHAGPDADRKAKALHARAFTVGSDVYFAAGEFQPSNKEGMALIAHELTHVVQQGGSVSRKAIHRKIAHHSADIRKDLEPIHMDSTPRIGGAMALPTQFQQDVLNDPQGKDHSVWKPVRVALIPKIKLRGKKDEGEERKRSYHVTGQLGDRPSARSTFRARPKGTKELRELSVYESLDRMSGVYMAGPGQFEQGAPPTPPEFKMGVHSWSEQLGDWVPFGNVSMPINFPLLRRFFFGHLTGSMRMQQRAFSAGKGSFGDFDVEVEARVIEVAKTGGSPAPPAELLEQHEHKHVLQRSPLRPSGPIDRWEREAERVEARAIRWAEGGGKGRYGMPLMNYRGQQEPAFSGRSRPASVDSRFQRSRGASHGRPLSGPTRSRAEQFFGRDLGNVRVHDDRAAGNLTRMLGARAFAYGQDIYLGDSVRMDTPEGFGLVAHEVAHTMQQGTAGRTAMGFRLGLKASASASFKVGGRRSGGRRRSRGRRRSEPRRRSSTSGSGRSSFRLNASLGAALRIGQPTSRPQPQPEVPSPPAPPAPPRPRTVRTSKANRPRPAMVQTQPAERIRPSARIKPRRPLDISERNRFRMALGGSVNFGIFSAQASVFAQMGIPTVRALAIGGDIMVREGELNSATQTEAEQTVVHEAAHIAQQQDGSTATQSSQQQELEAVVAEAMLEGSNEGGTNKPLQAPPRSERDESKVRQLMNRYHISRKVTEEDFIEEIVDRVTTVMRDDLLLERDRIAMAPLGVKTFM